MKREILIKEIIEELSILQNRIKLLSQTNLRDINLVSEYHIQEILNMVFGYKLINSNSVTGNAIAIDLQDDENRVAVQVTATASKSKIQSTLNKFFAAGLQKKYDVLLIFILGQRQKKYLHLEVPGDFYFEPGEHIFDFASITRKLSTLTTMKVEAIRNILKKDKYQIHSKDNPVALYKKNKLVRKSLEQLVHKDLTISDYEVFFYAPYQKFIYDSIIVRSVKDRTFPNYSDMATGPLPPWYRALLHDFYEYGLEVRPIYMDRIVVNNNGKWNYLGKRNEQEISENMKVLPVYIVHRIPYDAMVEFEMETDGYFGYPSLYLNYDFLKDIDEVPISLGYFNSKHEYASNKYFENKDRDINL